MSCKVPQKINTRFGAVVVFTDADTCEHTRDTGTAFESRLNPAEIRAVQAKPSPLWFPCKITTSHSSGGVSAIVTLQWVQTVTKGKRNEKTRVFWHQTMAGTSHLGGNCDRLQDNQDSPPPTQSHPAPTPWQAMRTQ